MVEDLEQITKDLERHVKLAEDRLNQLKYLQADFENYRKWSEKEKASVIALANESLIKDLLVILDDFDQAIPSLEKELEKLSNSLLQQENCTWAFLGNPYDGRESERYLFWTSLNTNKVGGGVKIPVIIQTGDGKHYVSETTTGERTKKSEPHKGEKYIAVSEQITSRIEYKKFLKAEAKYSTLEEAYDAYVKALAKDEYKGVREKCL